MTSRPSRCTSELPTNQQACWEERIYFRGTIRKGWSQTGRGLERKVLKGLLSRSSKIGNHRLYVPEAGDGWDALTKLQRGWTKGSETGRCTKISVPVKGVGGEKDHG